MKGTQAAVAIGVGYVLGRRKKMRLATMLAIGAASGGLGRFGPAALRQVGKYVGKTDLAGALGPEVGDIVNTIRGDLLDASRAAAASAVTSRLDSFSDSLHDRAETLRNPAAAAGEAGEKAGRVAGQAGEAAGRAGNAVGGVGGGLRSSRRRGRAPDDEDAQTDAEGTGEYDEDDEPEGGLQEERRNDRNRRSPSRRRPTAQADDEDADEPLDGDEAPDEVPDGEYGEAEDEDVQEPPPSRRRGSRSPVARTRR